MCVVIFDLKTDFVQIFVHICSDFVQIPKFVIFEESLTKKALKVCYKVALPKNFQR